MIIILCIPLFSSVRIECGAVETECDVRGKEGGGGVTNKLCC